MADDLLSTSQVRQAVEARLGKTRTRMTIHRMIVHGVRLADGSRLKLPSRRVGHARVVSRAELREFLDAAAGALGGRAA
ncbi:MAG: hypothetical protein C0501_09820 [Isosphaera sp.]|nr:hypothetical protein [Isosphaera sp.]